MLSQKTAAAIHNCHQQIINAKKLLSDMEAAKNTSGTPDLADVFGRPQRSLELGVPSGSSGHRILNVDYELSRVIIEAQIQKYKNQLIALNIQAKDECLEPSTPWDAEDSSK